MDNVKILGLHAKGQKRSGMRSKSQKLPADVDKCMKLDSFTTRSRSDLSERDRQYLDETFPMNDWEKKIIEGDD